MTPRIRDIYVVNRRLDPHETELRVHVELDAVTPTTEIRGRLMGPRCAYSSTIEIAYPMRKVEQRDNHVVMRVVIPEASWWEPETPFLYEGPLELCQDGVVCERSPITHGIRALDLTSKGLKLNGHSYALRGKIVDPSIPEAELKSLHENGLNFIMTSFRTEREWDSNIKLWYLADRIGLFLLCRALNDFDFLQFQLFQDAFACAFGCVAIWENGEESRIKQFLSTRHGGNKPLFGVESTRSPIPETAVFMLCNTAELASMSDQTTPKIVLCSKPSQSPPTRSDLIGAIELAS